MYSISISYCGPCILLNAFPFDDELIFYKKKKIIFLENDMESPLIFVLFLKGKQNKKENPSVTPYLEMTVCEK